MSDWFWRPEGAIGSELPPRLLGEPDTSQKIEQERNRVQREVARDGTGTYVLILSAFFFETRECISFAGVSFIEMYEGPWEGRRCSVRVAEGRHIRYLGYVTVVQ